MSHGWLVDIDWGNLAKFAYAFLAGCGFAGSVYGFALRARQKHFTTGDQGIVVTELGFVGENPSRRELARRDYRRRVNYDLIEYRVTGGSWSKPGREAMSWMVPVPIAEALKSGRVKDR